ncbi:helix-turn-helix domain-containing protein, partial [Streptomyces sp. NPDC005574]|uniref:helix-turn-helix transcriptional regulator n=1 Tax=Streptomyces sp. NPDC005574 TaxID=3156891 RepID=UPI0033BD18F9
MTVSEIALEHGVSRQSVHSYRTRGSFPQPVEGEGSTRPRFRADEVAAWFAENPPRPGKRTDLSTRTEGAPMATTEQPPSDTPEAEWSKADR